MNVQEQHLPGVINGVKSLDAAMMALYENMLSVDKRDPKLTAKMRQYGLIQQMQAMIERMGDLARELSKLLPDA